MPKDKEVARSCDGFVEKRLRILHRISLVRTQVAKCKNVANDL